MRDKCMVCMVEIPSGQSAKIGSDVYCNTCFVRQSLKGLRSSPTFKK